MQQDIIFVEIDNKFLIEFDSMIDFLKAITKSLYNKKTESLCENIDSYESCINVVTTMKDFLETTLYSVKASSEIENITKP